VCVTQQGHPLPLSDVDVHPFVVRFTWHVKSDHHRYEKGDFPEAEAMQRTVLSAACRVLGSNHPNAQLCSVRLATTLAAQGQLQEASTIWKGILTAREGLPEGEQSLQTALDALGSMLMVVTSNISTTTIDRHI
jgi:hypothetical protein